MNKLSDGFVVVCKRDCPTCTLVEPILAELAQGDIPLTIYTQDDPTFPDLPNVLDDTGLEVSYHLQIETVPTLIRIQEGEETERIIGWSREQWQQFTRIETLGIELPAHRPGCGSRSVEPGIAEQLAVRFGDAKLTARPIELATLEDEMEACYDRGWTDGLPVVPPTQERVLYMLQGTTRQPDEIVGVIPPNMGECTVEKAAINAVMAGCKPEYLPVVLAAVEAICRDEFCMHGVLATTYFSAPMIMVNGPVAKKIGMNSGGNALGQGNRANATIGRALQLIVRNVGGGVPGGVDRSMLGNPGKYTFCFAEREEDSPWEPYSVELGFAEGTSTVTLFTGNGVQAICDQKSRTAESLVRSFAACLRTVSHPKLAMFFDAVLVVSPEHAHVFQRAGWSKARLRQEIDTLLLIPGDEVVRGAGGIEEGMPPDMAGQQVPKFRPGTLPIVHAGGTAGLFSAIIEGWAGGPRGSQPVTVEIRE